MKKFLVLFALLIVTVPLYAGWDMIFPAQKDCYAIQTSSSTATLLFAAKSTRIGWTVTNPSSSYSVYIATYPITAAEIVSGKAWHQVLPSTSYWESNGEATPWPIYILSQSGQSILVSGEQRY